MLTGCRKQINYWGASLADYEVCHDNIGAEDLGRIGGHTRKFATQIGIRGVWIDMDMGWRRFDGQALLR